MDSIALRMKVVLSFIVSFIVLAVLLFVPAGTLDYWQAWVYGFMLMACVSFVGVYFLAHDPEFLERRMKLREKETRQKAVQKLYTAMFLISFVLIGLDKRFGWSSVPAEVSLAADAVVLLGYAFIFLVFKENSYAGRTIEVVKGQKVVSSGPYAIIRHPMYFGMLFFYGATPLALGSYATLPLFLLIIPILILRIRNEEQVLRKELSGYKEYCKKVRYRLVPLVW